MLKFATLFLLLHRWRRRRRHSWLLFCWRWCGCTNLAANLQNYTTIKVVTWKTAWILQWSLVRRPSWQIRLIYRAIKSKMHELFGSCATSVRARHTVVRARVGGLLYVSVTRHKSLPQICSRTNNNTFWYIMCECAAWRSRFCIWCYKVVLQRRALCRKLKCHRLTRNA